MTLLRFIVLFLIALSAQLSWATEIDEAADPRLKLKLQAPLTSFIEAPSLLPKPVNAIQALIHVPKDAPSDLGVGAYMKDDDGNWFQLSHTNVLKPGTHHLHFSIRHDQSWQSEPFFDVWNPYQHYLAYNYGLFFWSEQENTCDISIDLLRALHVEFLEEKKPPARLLDIQLDNINSDGTQCSGKTGERWTMRCNPDPMLSNPYDSDLFELNLIMDGPQGPLSIPGFYQKPTRIIDGGDRDRALPDGPGYFSLRFRPRLPGTYSMRLEGIWDKGSDNERTVSCPLPALVVSGEPWDEYARIDKNDFRFFRIGVEERFHWPLGMNIRSVTDPRGVERTSAVATPERIVHAYKAYFDRLSRAGANSVEIWMASWNVGLEWLDEWPGFHGIGAYHEGNAQRLDEILDYAYEKNIRVILVINNHGQASFKTDREWGTSPFNSKNGGPLDEAKQFFTHEIPLHAQQERRRYICARYADHPAVLCWKLFSEMNLTDMARNGLDGLSGPEQMRLWHKNAFDAWKALDTYDHPVTSHWSGDYRVPYRELVALENMDFTAIDAYHGRRGNGGRLLAQIMYDSTLHPTLGLSAYKKPLVCTEFGASAGAGPEPQLTAEHMSGPWAALMSGHASSPHLWWYEWTDQGDRFHPYRAISEFLKGEDFRSPQARCVHLHINHPQKEVIWCRAWFKPGCIYGYLLDWNWGYEGLKIPLHQKVSIQIGSNVKPGTMQIEWWDASTGHVISSKTFKHQSGGLTLTCPDFRRHLAFKLRRVSQE